MKAEDLLYNLKSSGIELRAEGEQLRWRAPRGIMGSDLLDSIKLHKPELLALLKSNKADDYCQDHMNQIIHGDCLKVLEGMPDNSIDLIVTDPPYGINFMGKDWDKEIASVEVWKECYRVLKPGAFAFIISYPRLDVFHLNTMNVKSAGLRIDFSPLFWAHKKGALFHGSMDKAIDKRNGAKRNEIARNPNSRENCNKNSTLYRSGTVGKTAYITKPVTAEAQYFEGSYPGFLPRPIVEPIIVVMKPCEKKTYIDQALSNGKGVTWLGDCRIPCENESSRLPGNLLVSDNVLGDDSRYFSLDAWAGLNIEDLPEEVQHNLPFLIVPRAEQKEKDYGLDQFEDRILAHLGGAQKAAKMGKEEYLEKNVGFTRIKKVKNNHPTVKPIKLMSYLITMGSREADVVLDPYCGSGSTCMAAKMLKRQYIGVELSSEYHKIAKQRVENS